MPIPSPFTHPVAAAVAATAVALLATACGGTSPSPPTATGGQKAGAEQATAFHYATCMRDHGLPGFPDPVVHTSSSGGSTQVSVGIHVTPALTSSPKFKSAQAACGHILPGPGLAAPSAAQQRARAQALLAFARCLRSHGQVRFPDPDAQGHLSREQVQAAGIDLHSPGFATAARACVGVTHGMITGADVERAINGGS